ncbi:hypothetical protein L228DRAFT_234452 [Xylona heveae TC161]|uniref:Outer spore wall protein RRT8 n=1 Tax=Xylona heveae (strain CBS 132557 / TC161) TaxID=1328760 RepID=A0A164ZL11_XYLHT|nr:hypothetical protein L228DRAFT_234452 [Xylona heveae TC161]KZF19228.1 hypothetical protein L228DRAFT_234452 [Xylona heveae TC161]
MSAKVKETVSEEVVRVRGLTADAARSGAYLYPLKGIAYFATHRSLWKPFLSKLLPTITLGIGVTATMFVFTYLPQAAVLAVVNGPLAAFTTVLLVLNESSTIFTILSKTFLIDDALIDTFDGTLVAKGMTGVVSDGREIKRGNDPISKLGKLIKKPFSSFTPQAIIRYFMYLPLNFIPVIGTILFLVLQGKKAGPTAHARYFQLKEWSKSQRAAFIHQNQGAYTSFGLIAVLLELIPVASILFSFTNTVGAALWAANIEKESTTAPNLREQAKKAE